MFIFLMTAFPIIPEVRNENYTYYRHFVCGNRDFALYMGNKIWLTTNKICGGEEYFITDLHCIQKEIPNKDPNRNYSTSRSNIF